MKRREVGKYFKRIEIDLERPDGSLSTLLENHWTMETDPLLIVVRPTLIVDPSTLIVDHPNI